MASAWFCPVHERAFFQLGLDLTAVHGIGETGTANTRRYCCPVCQANGLPGFMRPATAEEIVSIEQLPMAAE